MSIAQIKEIAEEIYTCKSVKEESSKLLAIKGGIFAWIVNIYKMRTFYINLIGNKLFSMG